MGKTMQRRGMRARIDNFLCSLAPAFLITLLSACSSGGGGGPAESSVPALSEVAIGDGESSLRLTWVESSEREDGSPVDSELSYRIHYWYESDNEQSVEVGPVNTVLLLGLKSGTYAFGVTSIDSGRMESELSERISLTVP